MVLEAPLVMTFCADWHRTRSWLRQRGARDNFNNLLGYHVAAYDAMIVAQNVCLGFEARGLGICYMGTTLYALAELVEFLQLPETVVPVTSIVAGYPAEDPPKRDRLPGPGAGARRDLPSAPTSAEIDAIYAEREVRGWQRYMAMPELKAQSRPTASPRSPSSTPVGSSTTRTTSARSRRRSGHCSNGRASSRALRSRNALRTPGPDQRSADAVADGGLARAALARAGTAGGGPDPVRGRTGGRDDRCAARTEWRHRTRTHA